MLYDDVLVISESGNGFWRVLYLVINRRVSPLCFCLFTTVRLKPVIKDSKILTYKTIISEISTRRI